ncbi:MAG: hypothetical protein ABI446_06705 [Gemmatimonadaceae bacterium]
MIALAKDGKHLYAGFRDDDMDFSGSLLKVAVLYAAFELRAAANRLAAEIELTPGDDLFAALRAAFGNSIEAVSLTRLQGKPRPKPKTPIAIPVYEDILELTTRIPPNGPVDFTSKQVTTDRIARGPDPVTHTGTHHNITATQDFLSALNAMIVESDDMSASQCISALGYSYINAVLMKAGLFKPNSMKGDEQGIWIGGEYENLKQSRILALNDGTGAFVMDTEAMCRLMALIFTGIAVNDSSSGGTSNKEMQDMLEASILGNPPFILRRTAAAPALKFRLARNKLGLAGLGRNEEKGIVASECTVLTWNTDTASDPGALFAQGIAKHNLTGDVVVCWQNLPLPSSTQMFDGIGDIVEQTYGEFLKT